MKLGNHGALANYLASPPLVVAYALAGTMDIDLTTDPLGQETKRRRTARGKCTGPNPPSRGDAGT